MTELLATLDRREGRKLVLLFSDGQELTLPAHLLPKNLKIGETIHTRYLTSQQAKADQAQLAKILLEEILNG